MRTKQTGLAILIAAAAVFGVTLVANSGDLDPPAGPVSPTGRTLSEIYNAAIAAGMSGGDQVMPVSDVRELVLMRITNTTIGDIRGEDDVFGLNDVIRCFDVDHEIVQPIDQASGNPTGARRHMPITVRKQVDQATPLLYNLLTTSGIAGQVELLFYRIDPTTRTETHYYTITLTDARVTGMRKDTEGVANNMYTHDEYVSFVYDRITWEHVATGNAAQDDYGMTPVR